MRVSELIHVENPWHSRLRWLAVFIVLFVGIVVASFGALDRIRTYSLPTGGIQLNTQYTQYLVGEPVSFTIKNGFNSPISIVTSCPSEPISVYRSVGKQWVRIHDTTAAINCSVMPETLQIPAAGSSTMSLADWPQLFSTAGTYRIALQVQYSNALPYVDFAVMSAPAPYVATAPNPSSVYLSQIASTPGSGFTKQSTPPRTNPSTTTTTTPTPTPATTAVPPTSRTAQTITLYVNSAGNYAEPTSVSMHTGDTLKIVYEAPYGNEVRTSFAQTAGRPAAIGPMTVDSEFRSTVLVLSSAGHWNFKADDHNGNSGSLVVLP